VLRLAFSPHFTVWLLAWSPNTNVLRLTFSPDEVVLLLAFHQLSMFGVWHCHQMSTCCFYRVHQMRFAKPRVRRQDQGERARRSGPAGQENHVAPRDGLWAYNYLYNYLHTYLRTDKHLPSTCKTASACQGLEAPAASTTVKPSRGLSLPSADREVKTATPRARSREYAGRTKTAGPGGRDQQVKRTTSRREMGSGRTSTCTRTCAPTSTCHKYLQDHKYLSGARGTCRKYDREAKPRSRSQAH
jgi:hypothetical protein